MNTTLRASNVDGPHASDEMRRVADILQGIGFPPWVESWTVRLDEDYYGDGAVRLEVAFRPFANWTQTFVRFHLDFVAPAYQTLLEHGIERYPYIKPRLIDVSARLEATNGISG